MSGHVIIRLQNLPLEARSIDIRRFFEGLQIPDGGVHIIGGEKGEAFIAFQSDEDARLAMARDSMPLCNARIKLYLSSKTEMQNVIAAARNQQLSSAPQAVVPPPAAPKSTLPTNIEQILFKAGPSVVPPKPAANPVDLITKLLGGAAGGTVAAAVPSHESKPVMPKQEISDPFKAIASLLPMITQNKPSTSSIPAVSTGIHNSYSQPQIASTQPTSGSAAAAAGSKININQIFDLLQSYKQVSGQPQQQQQPNNNDHHNSVDYSSRDYTSTSSHRASRPAGGIEGDYHSSSQSYRESRDGRSDRPMPYRHEAPLPPSQGPPKYASSNGTSTTTTSSATPVPGSAATPSSSSSSAITSQSKVDPIIRVKNFAPIASYKEIRTFLQGVQIEHDGIKLLHDANGQRTGQAFVRLIGIIDLKKALCRNKQFYEDRQIEVLQSNEHEFATTNVIVEYPAMQRHRNMRQQQQQQQPGSEVPKRERHEPPSDYYESTSPQGGVNSSNATTTTTATTTATGFYLKIYGLPANFDDQSLKAMFNNVKFVRIATAKPTPITTKIINQEGRQENTTIIKAKKLCQVETQLDLERALTRQDERVGKSKVQIFQISKSEYDREMSSIPPHRQSGSNGSGHANGADDNGRDRHHHNHNHHHHQHHHHHHQNQQDTEYMDTNERGDENSNEDSPNNNNNNGNSRGSRYRDEENYNNGNGHNNGGGDDDDVYLYMHGVPFSAREAEVKAFFPHHAQPRMVHFLIDGENFKPTGECCVEFGSRGERERALGRDGQLLRNRVIKIRPISVSEYRQYLTDLEELREKQPKRGNRQPLLHTPMNANEKPRLLSETLINLMKNQQANSNSSMKRSAGPNSSSSQQKRIRSSPEPGDGSGSPAPNIVELPPLPPELEPHKKSIVLLSNVSFEATREDILELFRPYAPIEQTLKIRHDDSGQPTGDAIVACKNADEAVRACARLNGSNFMGRNIRAVMLEP